MDKAFAQFIKSKKLELNKEQRELVDAILEQVSNDAHFLLLKQSGKTFVFKLLDEFFSSLEILDMPDFLLSNENGHAPKNPPVRSANQVCI